MQHAIYTHYECRCDEHRTDELAGAEEYRDDAIEYRCEEEIDEITDPYGRERIIRASEGVVITSAQYCGSNKTSR